MTYMQYLLSPVAQSVSGSLWHLLQQMSFTERYKNRTNDLAHALELLKNLETESAPKVCAANCNLSPRMPYKSTQHYSKTRSTIPNIVCLRNVLLLFSRSGIPSRVEVRRVGAGGEILAWHWVSA